MTTATLPSISEPGRPSAVWLEPEDTYYVLTQNAYEVAWPAYRLRELAQAALAAAEALEAQR